MTYKPENNRNILYARVHRSRNSASSEVLLLNNNFASHLTLNFLEKTQKNIISFPPNSRIGIYYNSLILINLGAQLLQNKLKINNNNNILNTINKYFKN